MPVLLFAFVAGEFLDEEIECCLDSSEHKWIVDGWCVYNPYSSHPYEWWCLE
jgi:hypothetical protein